MASYITVIHKDADTEYGVSFPDFPGCVSAGKTPEEAQSNAAEALALHIRGMEEDGEAVPAPTPLRHIVAPDRPEDFFLMLVEPRTLSKSVRINIMVPEDALDEIDRHTGSEGYSRSGFMVRAALEMARHGADE